MAIDPPSDPGPSPILSKTEFDEFCAACNWQGIDMTCPDPMSPSNCFDITCLDDAVRQPHQPSQSVCDLDVDCCDADDCSSPCATVCDGFVNCDKSTACSETHCDDLECHDTSTACFDMSCIGEIHGNFGQAEHELSTQNEALQWGNSPSCPSIHVNCGFPNHYLEHTPEQDGHQYRAFTPAETSAALKSLDIGNHAPHCISSRHPHVFDGSMCTTNNHPIPGNVLHCCTMSSPCHDVHSSDRQCTFGPAFPTCSNGSHLDFVPLSGPHGSAQRHQPSLGDMKMLGAQFAHIDSYARNTPCPSTHMHSSSGMSSPVTSPPGLEQSISSTFTTPDFTNAGAQLHVCKWVHKGNGMSVPCGASFPDPASLQDHLTTTHANAMEGSQGHGYYCCWEGCHRPDERFSQKSKLQGHFLTHSNYKNFRCSTCGKLFARQATLERHKRSHQGDKPYKCNVCSKAFTDSSELKTHLRTHTGEKPFKCNFPGCEFETGDSSNMSSHKLTHGVRKHKCPIPGCLKSFTRPDQLKRHLKGTHKTENISPEPLLSASSRAPSATPY